MSLPNFQSVAEMFRWRVQETPNNDALLRPTPQNTFEALSWTDVKTRAGDAIVTGHPVGARKTCALTRGDIAEALLTGTV